MIKALKRRSSIFLFFAIFSIYFLTSAGNTPHDYFTRLAGAFLEGRIYLTESPPWLNELIPIAGKYYVAYPPMPAIIAIPFVLVLRNFEQQWLAHLLGAGTAVIIYKLTLLITKNLPAQAGKKIAVWMGLLTAFGNVLWFLAATGSSWYLGQVSAAFFLTLAIYETLTKKRPLLMGIFLGAAYLSRVHTILSLPFFLYFVFKKRQRLSHFFAGLTPFLIFNALYNFARFGVLWDKGYMLISGVLNEPWYQLGLIHPSYIERHLRIIFTALPVLKDTFPYIFPPWSGLAIWLTTPAFLLALKAPFKKPVVRMSFLAIALIAVPILMHGTYGFAQFGYRFAVDVYPFLFLILIYALPKKLGKIHWLLLFLSILVNAWGVVWINKFGWVV
ncbi:hypothetical protein A2897_01320 [Candidatus Woesebacteria bacterium RIFCSPLOWO2_01_FULL_44_24b]|nr:MAG: hypothetical protein A2897_01320 [Candidatus Woesebacteria bacterium RIFCSPLOWO2_01_FULL_44_24b]